ncbi:hypothetical protein IMSAGC006_01783 [Muribaculaceae bacterium]|nr:hypothetical protein IMSAGC006_01783 [Muribaculaceae bacterium]
MGVAVERELTGHSVGQSGVDGGVFGREVIDHVLALGVGIADGSELVGVVCQQVVEFGDKALHGGDELDESFGNEHCAEVVAFGCACGHDAGDVVHDVLQGLVLGFHFLGDDADVRLYLQSAFQSYVAGGASHELDEVPVFLG